MAAREPGAAPLVVDVGGGRGALLAGILKAHPGVRGIVFDQPHVVDGARETLAAAGVADRCAVEGGDFFQTVPAGDAYILKNIIHDWDDARATTILRHCRGAIGPNGKLLLVELLLPPRNTPSFAHWADLEMLVMTQGGRERTEAEYAALSRPRASASATSSLPSRRSRSSRACQLDPIAVCAPGYLTAA